MDTPQLGPRYRALYPLAAGGMAEVWVGAQRVAAAQRPVAIKRILPQFADDPKYVRMFLDEAHLASCIVSPNVVALIDADVADDGAPFLVMELVEGLSLSEMLRTTTPHMTIGMVCYVIEQAAAGLHDAHEARTPSGEPLELVHRDVSPQNLLVGVDGRVRLADFGVARGLERMTQTQNGEFKGKLNYCAPEQLRGDVDRRADIFSLGVVIRQALSGQRLFGKSSSSAEAVRKLLDEQIQPTLELLPDLNPGLAAVVDKAIQRDPDHRYASAAEFGEALAPFADGSRTTLGKMVEAMGGAPLQARREKTANHFANLRDKDKDKPPSLAQARSKVPAETSVVGRVSLVPHSLPGRKRKPSWMMPVLLIALPIGVGVAAGVTGLGVTSSDDPLAPETSVTRELEPVDEGNGSVQTPAATSVNVEPSPENPETDVAPVATEPSTPRRRNGRGGRTAMRADEAVRTDEVDTHTASEDPDELAEPASSVESDSPMNRASRLRRDLF